MPNESLPSGPRQHAAARPDLAGPQARVDALRAGIAVWRASLADWTDRLARQHQVVEPVRRELLAAWREWLLALADAALQPGLSRAERRQLADRIHAWAIALKGTGQDAALDALAQRHAPDVELPQAPAQDGPASAWNDGHDGHDGDDGDDGHDGLDELDGLDTWERQAAAAAARRSEAAARRQAASASKRQAAQAQEASASVREVFRRLASALHPDREADPAGRARKTALMQEANRAYAAGDLPALLDLQLQAERVDGARPAATTAQRLQHHVEVLEGQLEALQAEARALEAGFRESNGLPPGIGMAPRKADRIISAQARRLRDELAAVRQMGRMALDVPALRAWLRAQGP